MEDQSDTPRKRKKGTRSPSYPSINLREAIDLIKIIKEKEGGGDHYIPYQAILDHWQYKLKSSPGLLKLAAVKKFGLIEDKGSGENREIRLSDLARTLLFYESNNDYNNNDYKTALQTAALNPQIHNELYEKYDVSKSYNLPSDQTLRTFLILNRSTGRFSENVVDDFINQLKTTFSLANLIKTDIISGQDEDKTPLKKEIQMNSMPTNQPNKNHQQALNIDLPGTEIPLILSKTKRGKIILPSPLTENEWKRIIAILEVYKPSLIEDEEIKQ